MDNSERIKKWKAERARVAEEERAARIKEKQDERLAQSAERVQAQQETERQTDSSAVMNDPDAIRRASLMIKERRIGQARQALRKLVLFLGVPLIALMSLSWVMTSGFYSADATFVVQSEISQNPTPGAVLFGGGNEMSEGFRVREYILSKEMMDRMEREYQFLSYFAKDEIALFSRYNSGFGLNGDPHKYYLSKVNVSADIQQGMLRLNVKAMDAQKAEFFAQRILKISEEHVNRMSERMQTERITWLENDVENAQEDLSRVRLELLNVQHIQKDIEPRETVSAIYKLIAGFETQRAESKAELDQLLKTGLDQSPVIPRLKARISVSETQIAEQRSRLSTILGSQGASESLSLFEDLRLQNEMAKARWEAALQTLQQGKLQTLRERRYLLVISQPMVASETNRYDDMTQWFVIFVLLGFVYLVISLLMTIRRIRE